MLFAYWVQTIWWIYFFINSFLISLTCNSQQVPDPTTSLSANGCERPRNDPRWLLMIKYHSEWSKERKCSSLISSLLLQICSPHVLAFLTTCPFLFFQVRLQTVRDKIQEAEKALQDFWAASSLWQLGQDARHDRGRGFLHGGRKKKGPASQFPTSPKLKLETD